MLDNIKKYLDSQEIDGEYSLFFLFPTSVEVIQAEESFNWVSYVAEFSGWLGLFLGLSVPHIVSILDNLTIQNQSFFL
jgi:hypothetical protein